ncbi:hypothetical protein BD410DRAFT_832400 [Rickenella mellea]|uniref:Uncharacterized protein n=1 Tax=Rickenella mellea TaxID=50990 RepID=A0A4Y7PLI9_9AGAM|nr:hypothetical protein BD410DRAFT_832400 [Rickenella mellea]
MTPFTAVLCILLTFDLIGNPEGFSCNVTCFLFTFTTTTTTTTPTLTPTPRTPYQRRRRRVTRIKNPLRRPIGEPAPRERTTTATQKASGQPVTTTPNAPTSRRPHQPPMLASAQATQGGLNNHARGQEGPTQARAKRSAHARRDGRECEGGERRKSGRRAIYRGGGGRGAWPRCGGGGDGSPPVSFAFEPPTTPPSRRFARFGSRYVTDRRLPACSNTCSR